MFVWDESYVPSHSVVHWAATVAGIKHRQLTLWSWDVYVMDSSRTQQCHDSHWTTSTSRQLTSTHWAQGHVRGPGTICSWIEAMLKHRLRTRLHSVCLSHTKPVVWLLYTFGLGRSCITCLCTGFLAQLSTESGLKTRYVIQPYVSNPPPRTTGVTAVFSCHVTIISLCFLNKGPFHIHVTVKWHISCV